MKSVLKVTLTVALLIASSGCSNFRSSKYIDMTPFADHTISLVADINYGLEEQHAVHLRRYMDDPAILAYEKNWEDVRRVLRGIAAYSLAIVTVSKSNLSEEEKVGQLADFLEGLRRPVVDPFDVEYQPSRTELDRILADIRTREKFLDGLEAAQPIVDWVAWYAGGKLDLLKDEAQEIEQRILEQVEGDFSGVVEFDEVIRKAQVMTLRSALMLSEYRGTGDPALMERLREEDPSLGHFLPAGNDLTPEQVNQAEARLVWRLDQYRKTQEILAADLATHNDMVRELDQLVNTNSATLMKTRATIWIWSRAHARLAAGITDPAKIDIMGIAKKAMDAALPY